ncbi:hypothetical protein J8I26_06565 [Herbaspirillum sp. LeCh32-8]|uniref:hypothetical protein n=1 Tax=Herbaspirillum sp. LeCh32-8 TaxID=2821356 RepID=UPI001AE35321|nr:hypothetical protein [Herbaspirillum sp. LeCh32-8]MBP0597756.1 hypothetical protein [Herbaspirillum sp. LeCh32-8]
MFEDIFGAKWGRFVAALVVMALLLAGFWNFVTGEPFYFNGQPMGFTDDFRNLKKAYGEQAEYVKSLEKKLEAANVEIRRRDKADEGASPWAFVDRVSFSTDGEFHGTKLSGNGRWSAPQSNVWFKLSSLSDEEAVFDTNFSAPFDTGMRFTKVTNSYEWNDGRYQLSVSAMLRPDLGKVTLLVERRLKAVQ